MLDERLKNYDLLIVPNRLKKEILEEIDEKRKLSPFKLITKKEFFSKITYSYDEKTIYEVMKKYHVKKEIAEIYIQNTYYVEEREYSFEKLNFLKHLKQDLFEKKLLKENIAFQEYVKSKKVAFYGYDHLDSYEKKILKTYQVKMIPLKEPTKDKIPYYEFSTMEEEVVFVANYICQLLEQGTSITNIKLTNVGKEYEDMLTKIFSFYKIPLEQNNQDTIYGTSIAHATLSHLSLTRKELWDFLKEEFDFEKEEIKELGSTILDVLNHYAWSDSLEDVKELIEDDFKHTEQKKESWKEAVQVVPLEEYAFSKEEQVFLLGCNQGIYPTIYKDEDYIPDMMKDEVELSKTVEKNKQARKNAKLEVLRIHNLIITSKRKSAFEEYLPSSLLQDLPIEQKTPVFHKIHYSKLYDELTLAKKLDQFQKYGVLEEDLPLYFSTFPSTKYQTYQNDFTGISKNTLFHRIKNQCNLSYTALDSYKRCAFRYYVNRVLRCVPFEETFSLFIGNLFHEILKTAFEESFDFEKSWNESLQKKEPFTSTERFFLGRLKEELRFDIETMKEQELKIGFSESVREKELSVMIPMEIPTKFHGIIDKIYYKEMNGEKVSAIIDYKTGMLHTNLSQIQYGINMQLPIYYYLLKHSKEWNSKEIVGFYLQRIVNGKQKTEKGISEEDAKRKALRLVGYSTSDRTILSSFDPDYQASTLIKGLKEGSGGFYANAKVLSKEEFDKLDEIVENQIHSGITDILNAKFDINPKVIGFEQVGCEACSLKDICYMKEKDKVYYKEEKGLEFLKD